MEMDRGIELQLQKQSLQTLISNLSSDAVEADSVELEGKFNDLRQRAQSLQNENISDAAMLKSRLDMLMMEYNTLKQ